MDLERVKHFAERRRDLEDEIRTHEPDDSGQETLDPFVRFEDIWKKLDELAGGLLDRSSLSIDDDNGTSVTISRKAEVVAGKQHSGMLNYANSERSIEVQWVSDDREFPVESLTDREALGSLDTAELERRLGLIEESVTSLERMMANWPDNVRLIFADPSH